MEDKQIEFENSIQDAMDNKEMIPFYQPQYDAITGKLVGAEALIRWKKPDGSMVMPGSFIPQLENSPMIIEVDWYMLEAVCDFQNRIKDTVKKCVPISVNFSRQHFHDEKFVETLCRITDKYNVPHKLIEVEITEAALMNNPKNMIELVAKIRDEGFDVAIDDFGSGLSSLSLVKDISANILKIDKSLLDGNCENEKERIVLESIFTFANRLKLKTVAEGVETKEQLGFLRTCDCKIIQGFLFARPMPEKDFLDTYEKEAIEEEEDILLTQAPASATQLLLEAVFMKYPLVILSNLSRNSYYMMAYENFSAKSCPSTGVYDELIAHGASTMHPEDQELFRSTFTIQGQIDAYKRGEKSIRVVTRQIGDDGVYRRTETVNYFVKNPSSEDILVISLCQNLE